MRIFIYEYTCGGGETDARAAGLQAEGWAMLSAFLEDFGRIAGVQTLTLLEPREQAFRELARTADYSLIIAPEFDDILLTRCRWVVESGGRLLGPSLAAVKRTADKLALGDHLRERGIPVPQSHPFVPGEPISHVRFPLVWKPRHGAGSQATFLVHHPHELQGCMERAQAEGCQGEALVQPFVPGQPASVAFLIGPRSCVPLLPAAQRLSRDGRFRYLGGQLPLPPELVARAVTAARKAVDAVPGLHGYVGVDLVLGPAEDGSGDMVIEINPRPTTSYVGLRRLAEQNLAEALLQVAATGEMPLLSWRSGIVHFDADGTVRAEP